jgi:hypothetical protein
MRSAAIATLMLAFAGTAAGDQKPPTATDIRPWIIGTWSFDGSCASGDGMRIASDGKANFDEWGAGLWALDEAGLRLVIIAEDIREDADRREEAELIEFRITARQGNAMSLTRLSDRAKIEAVRCGVR